MTNPSAESHELNNPKLSNSWILSILALCLLVRVLLSYCLGLADDEAYYWDWSRQLSLSYFDHPGMIAWMIHLSTTLFGTTPLAVRLPGLLCHTGALFVLAQLAREMFGTRIALISSIIYLFTPMFGLASLLVTPDAPMALFWLLTLWCLWRLANDNSSIWWSSWGWILLGLCLGLGLLSKYTTILLVPTGIIWMHTMRPGFWRSPWFGACIAIAALVTLPILVWNYNHAWPSLRFHLVDRQTGGISLTRWFKFLASQIALLTPLVFCGAVTALALTTRQLAAPRWRFISIMSLPILLLFCIQALFADYKPHWPAPGFLLPLVGMVAMWQSSKFLPFTSAWRPFITTVFWLFLLIPTFIVYVEAFYPLAPKVARQFKWPWHPQWDATNDFYGWDTLTRYLLNLQKTLPDHPVLASWRYQSTAQLAFASGQHVWRLSHVDDQYTFTQNTQELKGRSALFVNDARYKTDPPEEFEACSKQELIPAHRAGELIRNFEIWHCRNYRIGETVN